MAKPSAVKAAAPHLAKIAAPLAGAIPAKKSRRSPKGRPLLPAMLLTPRFRRSLNQAMEHVGVELVELGLTSEARLRKAVIEGYRKLAKSKVTATDWLGSVFQGIVGDLEEVKIVEAAANRELLNLVNSYISRKLPGFHFTSGYGADTRVTKVFGVPRAIEGCRIRRPDQPVGVDYVDRGHMARNADGQFLFVAGEVKTRGAAGGLKDQVTNRDARLIEAGHPPGTEMVFTLADGSEDSVDLKDVILVTGSKSPAFLREAGVFSRIGVRAGTRFSTKIAVDDRDEPYVRVIVSVATDPLRRILEKLLRDRSWQR